MDRKLRKDLSEKPERKAPSACGRRGNCPGCPSVCRAALAGNPNVGKSTLFNALTGLHQHVGNWTGKTVSCASGFCRYGETVFEFTDLPGTYSLRSDSPEEEAAREAIGSGRFQLIVAVCDATSLERSMGLVFQILDLTPNVILCVNLWDEARKKGISIDFPMLEKLLGIPVIPLSAARGEGLPDLLKRAAAYKETPPLLLSTCEAPPEHAMERAGAVARRATVFRDPGYRNRDLAADRILTGPVTGALVMLGILFVLFWLSLSGANYPSALLSRIFSWLEGKLLLLSSALGAPAWLQGALIFGIYRVTAWVISVMLPPMAIFFPLFTLLEDLGYLPRAAFNLDHHFKKCSACGKQALCMCRGRTPALFPRRRISYTLPDTRSRESRLQRPSTGGEALLPSPPEGRRTLRNHRLSPVPYTSHSFPWPPRYGKTVHAVRPHRRPPGDGRTAPPSAPDGGPPPPSSHDGTWYASGCPDRSHSPKKRSPTTPRCG